jgi:hypothetical protein
MISVMREDDDFEAALTEQAEATTAHSLLVENEA